MRQQIFPIRLRLLKLSLKRNRKQHVVALASVIDRLLRIAHNTVLDYQLVIPIQLLSQSLKTQRVFDLVLAVVTGGISLLIGGIGIMNIMLGRRFRTEAGKSYQKGSRGNERGYCFQFLRRISLVDLGFGGMIGMLRRSSSVCI